MKTKPRWKWAAIHSYIPSSSSYHKVAETYLNSIPEPRTAATMTMAFRGGGESGTCNAGDFAAL